MGLAFDRTSFFPNIELNDILEREFQISYNMNIPFDYNKMEYYEFVWYFERLVKARNDENSEAQHAEGLMSLKTLGASNFSNMGGDKNGR